MDKPVLYVDMDNTLFSFPEESITCFEDFYKPGLFINEKPHWNVIHAVHMIHEAGDLQVRIISAFPDGSVIAVEEKNLLLDRYLPWVEQPNRIFLPTSMSKAAIIRPNAEMWLLDDYSKNCNEWKNAGGNAIKLVHDTNGAGEKWAGARVDYSLPKQKLMGKIYQVIYEKETA